MIDIDKNTLWIANGKNFPAEVIFQLPATNVDKVKKVVVTFENNADTANRFMDVTLKHAVNNVTQLEEDWITDNTTVKQPLQQTFEYEYEIAQSITHAKIILNNPLNGNQPGTFYPAIADVKIYVEREITNEDNEGTPENIASEAIISSTKDPSGTSESNLVDGNYGSISYQKPVHSNGTTSLEKNINDGSLTTSWSAPMYPAYVDIDLEKNYNLSSINVLTTTSGFYQYTIYTSMDGRNFSKLLEKQDKEVCPNEGITYDLKQLNLQREARIVRVYVEYNSNNNKSVLSEVRVYGEESGTPIQTRPAIKVENFNTSQYNQTTFTNQEVTEEVKGIVRRTVGEQYVDWFEFEIAQNPNGRNYDFYTISNGTDGKIKIKGNNGVSLATGLNYYYKYYCNVNITEAQVEGQKNMPTAIVPVEKTISKETKIPVRYAYNYCTHSYTMSFWGEEEWQAELDWLALNGVNLVLDLVGQEEVWRRFLNAVGYNDSEVKDFLAGPAYYAWVYMQNLTGAGGPLPDSWFEDRVELARKNQLKMRKLGMEPIMQGYSGMVPADIVSKDPDIDVIPQGGWCSYIRPYMIRTTSNDFDTYADLFYRVQKEVYGDMSHHYATDPFHEGGNQGGMSSADVASSVMEAMLRNDSNGVWVIQHWLLNPTNDLLKGLEGNRDHALILDLYAEQRPDYKNNRTIDGVTKDEFFDTPWVYCMLNNFGGRMGFNGNLDALTSAIPTAANQYENMKGIGITPEATQGNPLLYDFFFDTIWSETPDSLKPVNINEWLTKYQIRRYKKASQSALAGLTKITETAYKHQYNTTVQGASESVVNAQPALSINSASTWGSCTISYNKNEFVKAAKLLLQDYDELKSSKAYIYDLVDVYKQVLSNTAQEIHSEMTAAFTSIDFVTFEAKSNKFLELIDAEDELLSAVSNFRLGTWTTNAQALAEGKDDYTKDLYLYNAKALLTTWGSKAQRDGGGLRDYSNRQWSDLTRDFYKQRWEKWISAAKENLKNGSATAPSFNWFEWEWEWVRSDKSYSNAPNTSVDVKALATKILTNLG